MSLMTEPTQEHRPRRTHSRPIVAVLLVVSLIATALTRSGAIKERQAAIDSAKPRAASSTVVSSTSLDAMPSFATALLLGGLRGPLVMMLWSSSESQKQEHQLEDFDTKIEWIRILQPEFDTVHLFQVWNKAYNISVQMANLSNKYLTILDAIDYAMKVDKARRTTSTSFRSLRRYTATNWVTAGNTSITAGGFDARRRPCVRVTFPNSRTEEFRAVAAPLGWNEEEAPVIGSQKTEMSHVLLEKPLVDRLKEHFTGDNIKFDNLTFRQSDLPATARRERLDSMLDIDGNILPELLVPRFPQPADLPAGTPWYDGSELEYLKTYSKPDGPGFPYGLSAGALEYNLYRRAQELQDLWNERHIQSGDAAVDGRVGLAIERWAKDEWERGRRFELHMWGHPVAAAVDPDELEGLTQSYKFTDAGVDDASRDAALYSYAMAARLWGDAKVETRRHIQAYRAVANAFYSHLDDESANQGMLEGDHDYLAAMAATGAERDKLIASAEGAYMRGAQGYALIILKYYTDDAIVYRAYPTDPKTGQPYSRMSIDQADPSILLPLYSEVQKANAKFFRDPNTGAYQVQRDQFSDLRTEYEKYLNHCKVRLSILLASQVPQKPAAKH